MRGVSLEQMGATMMELSGDAAYKSMLMQNHRLRVMLYLERKGISTLNLSIKALQYLNDGFKVGMLPDQLGEHLVTLLPIWERENANPQSTRSVQSDQRKVH